MTGRPISAADAKQLADAILERAESARLDYADAEAGREVSDPPAGLRFDVVAMLLCLVLGAVAFQMHRKLEIAERQVAELKMRADDFHSRINEIASLNWVRLELEEAKKVEDERHAILRMTP